MTSYELFEALLKERKLKAADVHRGTGVPTSTLTEWKKGKYEPKVDKLQKIADFFNVPITYFTGETELPTPDAKNILEQVIASLGADAQVNFSASEMSEDEKAFLLKSLQNSLEKFELYKSLKEDWQDDNQ